ncbi:MULTISPECIES: hypothetical protein [Rhizobium]|uniref:hypothetical protein n=1 Tax=Rhizobium TaxID=379 RepID=UPI001B31F7CB|nr:MULTISPECIES: hypothetical protein [Rhizobium]MBX4906002.1 hypothetical protein [Rhizobium bangladeshense]MBX5212857.1 hypothetical protein [Rhizobium sp. NLR9a]MBX5220085.1 hypothetical protein [Rhizobium sp. NLR8a]MBX5225504.1 hypothetical protein [Rhizobium sp. NLR9b]MBX5231433.1 hypothetical protein [Rhizobium sp. NLR4a]
MPTTSREFKRLLSALSLAVAILPLPLQANAQAPPDKCVAPSQPNQSRGSADDHQDLSKKLDECNGELRPPPVGDAEMVEPAPDTGYSRIIRPGDMPPNTNPSNNSDD